jgi:membrane protease YdiL (CAAX protease family)
MLPLYLILPTFAAVLYFIVAAGHWSAPVLYALSKIMMVIGPGYLLWRHGWPPAWRPRLSWPRIIVEGGFVGLFMGSLIIIAGTGPLQWLLLDAAPRISEKINNFGITTLPTYLFASIIISVLHSAFEEWYWRVMMVGHLRIRLSPHLAIAMGGIAFAGHHIVVAWFYAGPLAGCVLGLIVGVAGGLWSLLHRRHGSIIGAWIAHMSCDFALMWLGWQAISSLN